MLPRKTKEGFIHEGLYSWSTLHSEGPEKSLHKGSYLNFTTQIHAEVKLPLNAIVNLPTIGSLETLVPSLRFLRILREFAFLCSLPALSSASLWMAQLIHIAPLTTSLYFCSLLTETWTLVPFPWCPLPLNTRTRNWCVQGALLRLMVVEIFYVTLAPFGLKTALITSPRHYLCSLFHSHPDSILTLLYETTLPSLPYWSWTCFCTFKILWTGDHITYHWNYDTFENEREPNNNFAGTTVVHQESPQQTRVCGHHTSVLKTKGCLLLNFPIINRKEGRGLEILVFPS